MTFIKSISGKQGSISGPVGEGLSPLDVASCIDVFEKYSKVQNPGQSIRPALALHTESHTLYGLAYACPHLDRQHDCPLKAIELLPFKQKIVLINCLSKEEKEIILEHHKTCSIK